MPIAINVSSIHFQQKSFLDSIQKILKKNNASAQNFEIEVTERTVMSSASETVSKLVKLKQLGFKLSIDDFGTGYSSLSYLVRFPLDVLKIDRSFIQHISSLDDKQAIVDAIIQMAHRLKMDVVAEGVESKQQVELLRQMGENSPATRWPSQLQARAALRDTMKKKYVGAMRYGGLLGVGKMDGDLEELTGIHIQAAGFDVVAPYTWMGSHSEGKYAVDFKKEDYIQAHGFKFGGTFYSVGALADPMYPLWVGVASAEWFHSNLCGPRKGPHEFADAFNRLLYAAYRHEDSQTQTFRAAAQAWRENPAKCHCLKKSNYEN